VFLNPKNILNSVKIPHGARVADFGTGAGHYALAVAERLRDGGVVYALDAFRPALQTLSKEAMRRGLSLYTLHSDLNVHIPFRDNLLKFGIVANLLHQLSNKEQFARELARVIEPGGQALVVDWAASFRNMGPTAEHAVAPGDAGRILKNAGFTIGDVLPAGTHHYAFLARVPQTSI
jgi:ubiquinone/menaquinone biosynthesis C-methylase UbiE